jgi:hypothetical protein
MKQTSKPIKIKEAASSIGYDEAVAEGKKIVAEANHFERQSGMKLGRLAASVETKYGNQTLARFAKAIGIAKCTLGRHLSVWNAWKDLSPRAEISYAVLRELQVHPDRLDLITDNPRMTKVDARKLVDDFKGKQRSPRGFEGESKRWFNGVVKLSNDIIRETAPLAEVTAAGLKRLRPVIQPGLLQTLREAAKALQAAADRLEELAAEDGPTQLAA